MEKILTAYLWVPAPIRLRNHQSAGWKCRMARHHQDYVQVWSILPLHHRLAPVRVLRVLPRYQSLGQSPLRSKTYVRPLWAAAFLVFFFFFRDFFHRNKVICLCNQYSMLCLISSPLHCILTCRFGSHSCLCNQYSMFCFISFPLHCTLTSRFGSHL